MVGLLLVVLPALLLEAAVLVVALALRVTLAAQGLAVAVLVVLVVLLARQGQRGLLVPQGLLEPTYKAMQT